MARAANARLGNVSATRDQLQRDAWTGDAVLLLFARLKILREHGEVSGERCNRLTSNQFLSAFGEPTAVEAEIGRIFATQGLEAAFRHIEDKLMPLYERQQARRTRDTHAPRR
jgi:hypothetical protein